MTDLKTKTGLDMIAQLEADRATTLARQLDDGDYMLIWQFEFSSLLMGWQNDKPFATGFVNARIFPTGKSAFDFVIATQVANGKGDHPAPIKATDARAIIVKDIDGTIATLRGLIA